MTPVITVLVENLGEKPELGEFQKEWEEELETVNIVSLLKGFAIRELRYGTVY